MRRIQMPSQPEAINKEWLEKSEKFLADLRRAMDEVARTDIVDKNRGHWTELREWLGKLSFGKCWYSEAPADCCYLEVEHFRPKRPARNLDGEICHEGYWWLAFAWNNFRLSGQVPNRRKGVYFPLLNQNHAARSPNDSTADELPFLLDPIDENDWRMVEFDVRGLAVPSALAESDDWTLQRANFSIRVYGLNDWQPFIDSRRGLWARCEDLWLTYLDLAAEARSKASAAKHARAQEKLSELHRLSHDAQPYSRVVDCFLEDKRRTTRTTVAA